MLVVNVSDFAEKAKRMVGFFNCFADAGILFQVFGGRSSLLSVEGCGNQYCKSA